jgi:hypothetical protein
MKVTRKSPETRDRMRPSFFVPFFGRCVCTVADDAMSQRWQPLEAPNTRDLGVYHTGSMQWMKHNMQLERICRTGILTGMMWVSSTMAHDGTDGLAKYQ